MHLTTEHPITESRQSPATQYRLLLQRFALRFCVAVTLAVVLLGAVEIYSYWRYLHSGGDVLEPAVKLDLAENGNSANREYWKEFEQSNRVLYHQYVLWRRAPFHGELISINDDGIRRTLHTQCDDDGKTFTVWMFGDSVLWGAGSSDAETIPSLIARDYEKAGKPVCIVNFGEKGWSNTQEMIGLMEQLKHAVRKPDAVLFYDGGTEAFAAYQSGRADVHSNFNLFSNFLDNWATTKKAGFAYLRQTNTFRMLDKIAARAPFHGSAAEPSKPALDVETLSAAVVKNYQQNIQIIDLLAKQYGFRPIFTWYPNLAVGHKELTPYEQDVLRFQYEQFPDLGRMYQAVYRRAPEIKSPEFYDLENLVDDQKSSLYVGISHMKPAGDQIVADCLFNILEEREKSASAPATAGKVRNR